MKLPIFQVDAFANETFKGNPAAVVPLDKWLDDELMQKIAMENNLAETAFFVPSQQGFEIRWFTPLTEVDLCGHATLATAHVIWQVAGITSSDLQFMSRSGLLRVKKDGEKIQLDFPADKLSTIECPKSISEAIGDTPLSAFKGKTDYLLIFKDQQTIEQLNPNFHLLKQTGDRGIIVTAAGNEVDFVSRFFAPSVGIDEDPVTGSAHTSLTPYWSRILNKTKMTAQQLSHRGGELEIETLGERILISGKAVTYLQGEIFI